jgi:eukaryotic-like serine/threonine-protein kinase
VHTGAVAQLWRLRGSDAAAPLLMKIAAYGENPATIVSFEVEPMILPKLSGVHVPRFIAAGDF